MTSTIKEMPKGKIWLTSVLYGISLVFVVGLGFISPAWAEEEACPATITNWEQQAETINASYVTMQEALRSIDKSSPLLALKKIRAFERATTRWTQCLDARMKSQDDGTRLQTVLLHTQVEVIRELVNSAQACILNPKDRCKELAAISVFFLATLRNEDGFFHLHSSVHDDQPGGFLPTSIQTNFDVFTE